MTSKRTWTTDIAMFFGMAALLAAAPACSQTPSSGGPRLKADAEVFDFGYVPQNAIVAHTYWLRNTGTDRVEITKLQPNCGCTTAPLTDSLVEVGDSVPVEILFGSRNMTGKVEKFTRIISNATGRVPALTFKSHVLKPDEPTPVFSVSPAIVDLAVKTEARVAAKNVSNEPVSLRVVNAPGPHIRLDVKEISLQPEESKEIGLTLSASAPDSLSQSITLEASDPAKTRITVPITRVKRE